MHSSPSAVSGKNFGLIEPLEKNIRGRNLWVQIRKIKTSLKFKRLKRKGNVIVFQSSILLGAEHVFDSGRVKIGSRKIGGEMVQARVSPLWLGWMFPKGLELLLYALPKHLGRFGEVRGKPASFSTLRAVQTTSLGVSGSRLRTPFIIGIQKK